MSPANLPLIWTDAQLHADAFALLRQHVRLCGPTIPPAAAAAGDFPDADAAIVGTRIHYDAAVLSRAPRLKFIARTGIGYDNIDVPAASAAGIGVINTPDAPTESTAEFAIALMFAVARRITVASGATKSGIWKLDATVLGFDLAEKSLGLVGFGRIARRVAEIARAIRMRISAYDLVLAPTVMTDRGVTPCADLPELLQGSQVLSLHAPLLGATRRMIGADQLALLPAGAILVNTARGPLVDEAALLAALERGHVAGAGIDVWEREPVDPANPLLRHPHVVATPHMAAFTEEGRKRSHVAAAQFVLAGLRGEMPATLVDPTMWPRRRLT
jgi:D-3-phosphoglycerate dehydrogenase / 2-oxoglutarate reductase